LLDRNDYLTNELKGASGMIKIREAQIEENHEKSLKVEQEIISLHDEKKQVINLNNDLKVNYF
jgi:hypothetical protein